LTIRRVVPKISSKHVEESKEFYVDLLGFQVAMDIGFIATLVSPANPTAQISIAKDTEDSPTHPPISLTIEVANVDEIFARAEARGVTVVYPLTNESWGVRRFAITDPNGTILNIMSHAGQSG
jgi:uncharacterized glyoxalase superfamily protein PhnB